MKNITIYNLFIGLLFTSCEKLVDGINDDPNKLKTDNTVAEQYLTGAMLANSVAQGGHINRIAGLWSGHLIGFSSVYSHVYGYNISTAEPSSTWRNYYVGTIPNLRIIREKAPKNLLIQGISKVLEAHAMGTVASIFGDIPYSEINNPLIDDPKFDSQEEVFNALISLLDSAILDLEGTPSRKMVEDIYYEGNADKWKAAAATLKARYYLQLKMYTNAYTAALNGIMTNEGNMKFTPRGEKSNKKGDKNLFWMILNGSREGNIGTRDSIIGDSYLMELLNSEKAAYRGNAKTNEEARYKYYTIDTQEKNFGIIAQFEPQNLVSYAENLLILAETEARLNGVSAKALEHLNEWRQFMNAGGQVNANFQEFQYVYEDYVTADFDDGGIENQDNIASGRALLREIIEERYISGMGMYMAFNDARRLAKDDSDLLVPFPLNTEKTDQKQPQRLPYSDEELNTNANAPEEPGIYEVTEVNK